MGLLVLGVIIIAAAIPTGSVALGYTALALVVSGVVIQFAAIVLITRVMIRSADTLTYETRRTDQPGLAKPSPPPRPSPLVGRGSIC
jgi:hypothetical protein